MSTPQRVDPADLVGLTEIAIRAGVTNAAVANWAQRYDDFPASVRTLSSGRVWLWSQVDPFLQRHGLPDPAATGPHTRLTDAQILALAKEATAAPRADWPALARQRGVGLRFLETIARGQRIGEPYGWWTRQTYKLKETA